MGVVACGWGGRAAGLPVIGNGDVLSWEDYHKHMTDCDGKVVGVTAVCWGIKDSGRWGINEGRDCATHAGFRHGWTFTSVSA
jgi:hypothetical protein